MWHVLFEDRLRDWHALRSSASGFGAKKKYTIVNDWWFQTPMVNKSLCWSQYPNWPDPWQLLAQNQFCDLARALGIVYTLNMIDNKAGTSLAQTDRGNLVLVDGGKYILNWAPRQLLNIESQSINITRQIDSESLNDW